MKYTFQIKWPLPFSQDWQTSGIQWDTAELAGKAMLEFLLAGYENGTTIAGRIIASDTPIKGNIKFPS